MITVIDYGLGNISSVMNLLHRAEVKCLASCDLKTIEKSKKIILPGVGAFDAAMTRINQSGLRELLEEKVIIQRIPFLGICLGMQLLTRGSEEGKLPGFGWIKASARKIPENLGLKVPHMGWNLTKQTQPSELTQGLEQESRFYFVHSYYVTTDFQENTVLQTHYGISFAAAIQHGNIMGVQFHPEKSHRFGRILLENFAKIKC